MQTATTTHAQDQEPTNFKTFASFSELLTKCRNHKIYIELSNEYFIAVNKSDLKKVADSMKRNDGKFCGNITLRPDTAQVKLSK